jgi:hypothetical protein
MVRLISVDVSRNGRDSAFVRVANVFNRMGRAVLSDTEVENKRKREIGYGSVVEVMPVKRRAFQTREQYDNFISTLHESLRSKHGEDVNIYPLFGEK